MQKAEAKPRSHPLLPDTNLHQRKPTTPTHSVSQNQAAPFFGLPSAFRLLFPAKEEGRMQKAEAEPRSHALLPDTNLHQRNPTANPFRFAKPSRPVFWSAFRLLFPAKEEGRMQKAEAKPRSHPLLPDTNLHQRNPTAPIHSVSQNQAASFFRQKKKAECRRQNTATTRFCLTLTFTNAIPPPIHSVSQNQAAPFFGLPSAFRLLPSSSPFPKTQKYSTSPNLQLTPFFTRPPNAHRAILATETLMPNQTGPTSEEGKEICSRNAVKHGLTSRKNLVEGESEQEQQALITRWHEAYPTDNEHAANLVNTAAHSEWQFLRVQRGVDDLHMELFETPMTEWTNEQHAKFKLFTRYLTTAQRTLDRHRTAIHQYRREIRAEAREQRLTASKAAKAAKTASKTPPDPAHPLNQIEKLGFFVPGPSDAAYFARPARTAAAAVRP